jgi:CheY-like chemotaxis protein
MLVSQSAGRSLRAAPTPRPALPARGEQSPTTTDQPKSDPVQRTSREVLVIEDNADSRETLRMLIELWGHHVDVAADGAEGVRMALENPPDVAVIDIGLPLVNGYEVARRIRQAFGNKVRLIALTAYARPDDRRRAVEAGFHFFMSKPADFDMLARLLRR